MAPELSGYLFPNDVHIHWSLMIVMYPYITGLVAGAFIVSSLYHVFERTELRPVGRFALAASLCFLAVATMPLLNHLGHPERGPMIMATPNFSSAMAGFGTLAYEKAGEWEVIGPLLTNQLAVTFIGIQMGLGGFLPFVLLAVTVTMGRHMDDRLRNTLAVVSSLLLLLQVLAMRWNVVIGGQMFSKSMRGFREKYVPGMFEKEGILAAVIIFLIPFVLLVVFERILPTFAHLEREEEGGAAA